MVDVDSEAILEIDYDPSSGTLFVRFTDGDWYRYLGVAPQVHAAFVAANSHGPYSQTVSAIATPI